MGFCRFPNQILKLKTLNQLESEGKKFDTWHYIVICAKLCLSFSSKSQATNVFPKQILKLKAGDQSVQARKKLFCHMIVKNYLCNVLWKFLIKIKSIWRGEIKDQTPQLTLLY